MTMPDKNKFVQFDSSKKKPTERKAAVGSQKRQTWYEILQMECSNCNKESTLKAELSKMVAECCSKMIERDRQSANAVAINDIERVTRAICDKTDKQEETLREVCHLLKELCRENKVNRSEKNTDVTSHLLMENNFLKNELKLLKTERDKAQAVITKKNAEINHLRENLKKIQKFILKKSQSESRNNPQEAFLNTTAEETFEAFQSLIRPVSSSPTKEMKAGDEDSGIQFTTPRREREKRRVVENSNVSKNNATYKCNISEFNSDITGSF